MSRISPEALRLLALLDELERARLIGNGEYFLASGVEIPSSRNLLTFVGLNMLRQQEGGIEPPQQSFGCVCPPTSEQTCENPQMCPRKAPGSPRAATPDPD